MLLWLSTRSPLFPYWLPLEHFQRSPGVEHVPHAALHHLQKEVAELTCQPPPPHEAAGGPRAKEPGARTTPGSGGSAGSGAEKQSEG